MQISFRIIITAAFLLITETSVSAQIVNPTACEPTTEKAAVKALERAEKLSGTEKVKALGEVIKQYPDYYQAIFSQGMALIELEKFSAAAARFEKVYQLCPDYSPYTWFYLGSVYYGAERYAEAIPFLEKVVKYEGDLKLRDKDYEEAKSMLKTAKATFEITSKTVEYNPVPLENICTRFDEYTANLSPDNEKLYFIRKIPDNRSLLGFREVFMESENKNWVFDAGRELPPPFNTKHNNGAASITADNKTMYFVICQNNEYKACDIWYSEFHSTGWSEMKPVPGKINKAGEWDSQPCVSTDGKKLFFVSDRAGGFGGSDIYFSIRLPDGTWSDPKNLGPEINTAENELTPFLHSDGKTLYFSSKGHNSLGGYDIFISRQNPDGSWMKPKNLGSPINTKDDEVSFFVSLDGKRGFFSSDKLIGPGGKDLFMFMLHEEARPKEVKLLKGEIKSDVKFEGDDGLEIKNLKTKEVKKIELDKSDGRYVTVLEADQDYLLTIKKEGIAFNSFLIEKESKTETGLIRADLEAKKIEEGKSYTIKNINFSTNSYEITPKTELILEAFADFLILNEKLKVAIHGHTDDVGDEESNLVLSEKRAKAVYDFLIKKGIAAERLSYRGFGETRPLFDNSTESGRAQNRRTEFFILSK